MRDAMVKKKMAWSNCDESSQPGKPLYVIWEHLGRKAIKSKQRSIGTPGTKVANRKCSMDCNKYQSAALSKKSLN